MIIKTIKSLFSLGLGLLCAACLFEISLRVIELSPAWRILPVAEVSLYGPDENTGYTHRPNIKGIWTTENRTKVSTTSFGIRSNGTDDKTITEEDNRLKIGLIGNSMVEALQVADDKTFSALLEKTFNDSGRKVKVYNLGLSGSPPTVEAERARYFAKALALDLIIIIDQPYNISHRLGPAYGNTMPYYKLDKEGNAVIDRSYRKSRGYKIRQSPLGDAIYFFIDNFRIVTTLNNRMNRGLFAELTEQYKTQQATEAPDDNNCQQDSLETLANIDGGYYPEKRKLLQAFINDLKTVQETQNTKIVFSLYDTWTDCPAPLRKNAYNNTARLMRLNGISFLNLREALKQHPLSIEAGDLTALRGFGLARGHGHLNHEGHLVFSGALYDHIKNTKSLHHVR